MKLIIDIPEQMYLNAKADILCGADILVCAIKNGIPYETVTEFADRCRECGREKVLDKIRAEIEKVVWEDVVVSLDGKDEIRIPRLDPDDVFEIIDKYKAESEGKA